MEIVLITCNVLDMPYAIPKVLATGQWQCHFLKWGPDCGKMLLMDWILSFSQFLFGNLIPNVTVVGDRAFKEEIKVK